MKIKKRLRSFVFNLVALWAVVALLEGVSYNGGWKTLLLAALTLTVVNLLVKPLIKLLLLPINLITLGAFRWLVNVIALYSVTLIVPLFKISSFLFPGFNHEGFIIPKMNLSLFWVYVLVSFLISIITTFIYWLIR